MVYVTSLLLVSFVTAAHALNDWTKPCLSGVCSYDIPTTSGSSGSLKIWGDKTAISDITPAAGWEILGCSPDKLAQDIRLVCNSEDSKGAGCSHLFEGGAEGTIVRLPQECGKNAFARVAKSWVPQNQTIPAHIARRIVRRDGTQPKVEALTLDTEFGAIDASKTGIVKFALKGANVPGAAGAIDTTTVGTRRSTSRIYGQERGLHDFITHAIDSMKGFHLPVDKPKQLKAFSVNQSFNLLDLKLECPPLIATTKIDVSAKANAVATIGVAASGSIIPPKFDDFSIITSLTADFDSSVTLVAGLTTGALDSGKIQVYQVGISGLSFPGVLTIGPTFEVHAQVKAVLDTEVNLTVGLNYKIDKAELIFPPNSKRAQAADKTFNILDTPVKLSVSPSVKSTGSLEAHVIPSINLKVSALGSLVEAGVFLQLDASATMKLSFEGKADGSIAVNTRDGPAIKGRYWALDAVSAPRENLQPVLEQRSPVDETSAEVTPPAETPPVESIVPTDTAPPTPVSSILETDGSASFGGCFELGAGLDVNAGADDNFFNIFKKEDKVSLFSGKFEIFQKCFGNAKKPVTPPVTPPVTLKRATIPELALKCAVTKLAAAVPIIDEVVQALQLLKIKL